MTTKQRMSILLTRWPAACEAQGWDKNDRALRLEVISEAVGREIQSMNDLDNSADIDKVYAHLGSLADQVDATVETLPGDDTGYRRRLLWLIRKNSHELGGEPYVCALARDKFHITEGLSTINDLATAQLGQLMITLNARKKSKLKALAVQEPANCPF